MKFNFNTGGKPYPAVSQAGGQNDCVIRSLAIATGLNYLDVYSDVVKFAPFCDSEGVNVLGAPFLEYAERLGFVYVPKPCRPASVGYVFDVVGFKCSSILVLVQNHLTALKDNVLNDVFDCSKAEVKGYFVPKAETYNLYDLAGFRVNSNPLRYADAIQMYNIHSRNYRQNTVILPNL